MEHSLVGYGGDRPPIAQVAGELALSPAQVHASLKRLERSRLIDTQTGRPLLKAVEEFLGREDIADGSKRA